MRPAVRHSYWMSEHSWARSLDRREERVRLALKIADACGPCVLFLDECEKALAGVGGQGDSGVSARLSAHC